MFDYKEMQNHVLSNLLKCDYKEMQYYMLYTTVSRPYNGHEHAHYYKFNPSLPHWVCYISYHQVCYAVVDDFGNLVKVSPFFSAS